MGSIGGLLLLIEFLPLLLREFMANKSINPTGTHSTKPLETWGPWVVVITGQYPGRGRVEGGDQSQASVRAGGVVEGGVA